MLQIPDRGKVVIEVKKHKTTLPADYGQPIEDDYMTKQQFRRDAISYQRAVARVLRWEVEDISFNPGGQTTSGTASAILWEPEKNSVSGSRSAGIFRSRERRDTRRTCQSCIKLKRGPDEMWVYRINGPVGTRPPATWLRR